MTDLLLKRQDLDGALSQALKESGYLSLWANEVHKNKWRYTIGVLRNSDIPKGQQIETAKRELNMAHSDIKRFQHMSTIYQNGWRASQLRYFVLNLALYTKLIDLQRQRIAVAEDILRHQSSN